MQRCQAQSPNLQILLECFHWQETHSMAEYLKDDGDRGTPCLTPRALVLKNRLASLLKLVSGPTQSPWAWYWAQYCGFLTSSQLMPIASVSGPDVESTTALAFGWGLRTIFLARLTGLQSPSWPCGEIRLLQGKPSACEVCKALSKGNDRGQDSMARCLFLMLGIQPVWPWQGVRLAGGLRSARGY